MSVIQELALIERKQKNPKDTIPKSINLYLGIFSLLFQLSITVQLSFCHHSLFFFSVSMCTYVKLHKWTLRKVTIILKWCAKFLFHMHFLGRFTVYTTTCDTYMTAPLGGLYLHYSSRQAVKHGLWPCGEYAKWLDKH